MHEDRTAQSSEATNIENSHTNSVENLINARIEKLRPKLLDLTRRNPLISTKFSERSNSIVRFIDSAPSFLFEAMRFGKLSIVPLPPLDEELKDEATPEFQNALAEARANDDIYLRALDAINQTKEDSSDFLAKADRSLKDRLREKLGMPARQTKINLSLHQHALNHGINPNWDLPYGESVTNSSSSCKAQTLLLPDMLERRLNGLYIKDRSWKDEAGINVLHAVFGFLEWQENETIKPSFSPLMLLPIELEKKRTRRGAEFYVTADEVDFEVNSVLLEKLRLEFNVTFPNYIEGQSIEEYIKQIAEQKPHGMTCWKIHRWAVIGVFPSARLAMYYDLDTEANNWDFPHHPILSNLFGGNDAYTEAPPFGDEYNIDEPHIESKVPILVADADSSQVSTIVDIVDGKNLAVEGPPGTGKSQTIVNTIATTLAAGKKILFVAEKSAALEVVMSRLEACGLGNFLLALQATRSSKERVISSIRDRIRMEPVYDPIELDELITQYRQTRDDLNSYIGILKTEFGATGLNIHRILGKAIASKSLIDSLPEGLKNYNITLPQDITKNNRSELFERLKQIQKLWLEAEKSLGYWKGVRIMNPDPFKIEEILGCASKTAKICLDAAHKRNILAKFGLSIDTTTEIISKFHSIVESLPESANREQLNLAEDLYLSNKVDDVVVFLDAAAKLHLQLLEFTKSLINPLEEGVPEILLSASELMTKFNIAYLTNEEISKSQMYYEQFAAKLKAIIILFENLNQLSNCFDHLSAQDVVSLSNLVGGLSREALLARNESLLDPSMQAYLKKIAKKLSLLRDQRDKLKESFLISDLFSKKDVNEALLILEQAGMFAIFSSEYRKAKRSFLKIAVNKKFRKKNAVEDLNKLSSWMTEVSDFLTDNKAKELLGARFEGIESDVKPFLQVIEFFESIDEKFSGIENIELRALLRSGHYDLLISIPKIDPNHAIYSFPELQLNTAYTTLRKLEEDFLELKAAIEIFQKTMRYLVAPGEWTGNKLQEFSKDLKIFQTKWHEVSENSEMEHLLGVAFKGVSTKKTDIELSLNLAIDLASLDHESVKSLLAAIKDNNAQELKRSLSLILAADGQALSLLEKLALYTNTDIDFWFKHRTFLSLGELLLKASNDKEGLTLYSRFYSAIEDFSKRGYEGFIDEVLRSYQTPCNIFDIFEALLSRALAKQIYSKYQDHLVKFDGTHLSTLRKQIADLDRKIISLSRKRLQVQLYRNASPNQGIGRGKKSDFTEMALLHNEISKQQRFSSLRELTRRAGKALLELKPCWMMSPLSVAQYIPPGNIKFDIVIIDEASQMNLEDAIGALARAKQCMIVGDTNQLPPSSFFSKVIEDEGADEDEIVTEESILEMANATFKPARRLRWHYRSLHSGLIAFSNRHIYENDLVVFPAAYEDHPDMGVSYKYVENGLYSRGVNPEEAKVMVDAILDFMLNHRNLSLGVVVLNIKQRDLLIEEMNYAFERSPWAVKYQERWDTTNEGLEKFFIKNLENVQGDERDVIFIGTVYGPEKPGVPVMQRFGPINGIAGKRRLNVLFSRAKKKIVTFSSMTPANILAEENGNPGVYLLKRWLEYSATGKIDFGEVSQKEPDSDFELHVMQQIKAMGCEAIPQVGVSGYSIDIGIKHPDWPHGFIMGVECDGATYHSSKSARDRDRLRQEVLEKLGWYLHRIWSTDWFEDPIRETRKLREVIQCRMEKIQNK